MIDQNVEKWAEQQYEAQLERIAQVDEEPEPPKEEDPDSYRDNEENR